MVNKYTQDEKQFALNEAHEMMKNDAERLDDIRCYVERCKQRNYNPYLNERDLDFLIQQAEQVLAYKRNTQKVGELNVFLQGRSMKRWGDNVVDIAMDLIVEQDREIMKLKKELKK